MLTFLNLRKSILKLLLRTIPRFLLHKERGSNEYILLQDETETPISYHVACLSELKRANDSERIQSSIYVA